MDDWGIDVVLSASQKGLGIPPGLSVVCASQRAIKVSHRPFSIMSHSSSHNSRYTKLGRLQSPLTMQAGKSEPPAVSFSTYPQLRQYPQMASNHDCLRGWFSSILCDSSGQPDTSIPRLVVPNY